MRPASLSMIGGFRLLSGAASVDLPMSAQRLVAFLALRGRPLTRLHVACMLWTDLPEPRAFASLRSALWRLQRLGLTVVEATSTHLAIHPAVEVDVRDVSAFAQGVLEGRGLGDLEGIDRLCASGEVLPDWYDDWILIERERFRERRLHALEALCGSLVRIRDFARAVEAGLAAVAQDPLRESAHRAVMLTHLAESNVVAARRQYELYRRLIGDECGLEPSDEMRRLIGGATGGRGARAREPGAGARSAEVTLR